METFNRPVVGDAPLRVGGAASVPRLSPYGQCSVCGGDYGKSVLPPGTPGRMVPCICAGVRAQVTQEPFTLAGLIGVVQQSSRCGAAPPCSGETPCACRATAQAIADYIARSTSVEVL